MLLYFPRYGYGHGHGRHDAGTAAAHAWHDARHGDGHGHDAAQLHDGHDLHGANGRRRRYDGRGYDQHHAGHDGGQPGHDGAQPGHDGHGRHAGGSDACCAGGPAQPGADGWCAHAAPHSPRAGSSSSYRVGYTAAETCGLYGPVSGDYNHPRHLNCPVSVSQEYSISASALVALVDCALCHPPFQSKSHSVALQNHAPQDTL